MYVHCNVRTFGPAHECEAACTVTFGTLYNLNAEHDRWQLSLPAVQQPHIQGGRGGRKQPAIIFPTVVGECL